MAKPFVTPFATGGDKSAVPDASQADGSVSYTQGFGPDYQQEQGTPGAKDIPRDKTNQLFNDITAAISEMQRLGFAEYYPELAPYAQGATVWRAGTVYMSVAANNSTVPGAAGASWIVLGGDTTPVGTTIAFNAESPPTGYAIENGLAVPRIGAYAALFSVIGTRFGAGNGSTTFNLPESRGEFIRGADLGRGIDPSRQLGTFQKGSIAAEDPSVTAQRTVSLYNNTNDDAAQFFVNAGYDAVNANYPGISVVSSQASSDPTPLAQMGVTRPRNVSKLFCIKF